MLQSIPRRALTALAVAAAAASLAPVASASIKPTMGLSPSTAAAGSTANLTMDLKFAPTGTDSPKDLTIELPPGLLANASIDRGACLKTTDTSSGSPCEVGSGTVSATADPVGLLNVPVPVSVPVSFYLVPPPPASGDLAGLAVEGLGEQIGSTGEIRIRPTGDPDGVGVTLKLALPNQLPLNLPIIGKVNAARISLTEINSTFDSLRYPASCPSPAQRLSASVDSYEDATVRTASAPLTVTKCSSLPYSPTFKATATRDSGDRQVRLTTTVTQAASEAPSRAVSLALPAATLAPNLQSLRALCLNLASGRCQPVGSATAASPLYPTPLTGSAYLTGSASGLALTLVFPSPFPLTLTGAVDLLHNSATFSGLPDIPLTNLRVSLDGGTEGLFLATCRVPAGTATAMLTDQNGDRTVRLGSSFAVAGCAATPSSAGGGRSAGGGASGAGGGPGGAGPAASSGSAVTVGSTTVTPSRPPKLRAGQIALRFAVSVRRRAPRLRALTVRLPRGLSFIARHAGRSDRPRGITVARASVRSMSLSHGQLVIVLRRPAAHVTVTIGGAALHETHELAARLRRSTRSTPLTVTVVVRSTQGRRTRIRVRVRPAVR